MRWPWVARSTLEAVMDERDRLRDQNEALLDHLKRVDRKEHGMSELAIDQRPRMPKMPQDTRDILEGFDTPAIRRQMVGEAKQMALTLWESTQEDPWPDVNRRLIEAVTE